MSFTLTVNTFITDVMTAVDQVISQFVEAGFTQLVSNNLSVITLAMTVYVAWYGVRAIYHLTSVEFSTLCWHLLQLVVVFVLLTHWTLYHQFFYQIFTQQPAELIKTLVDVSGHATLQGEPTAEALNRIFVAGLQAANHLFVVFASSYLKNGMYFIYGMLVFIMTAASCLYALTLFIYAKLAMALLLFVGPIFLLFLLWRSTRGFFERWLQALMNYALIPLMTCGMLMLLLSITTVTLPSLQTATTTTSGGASGILPFIGMNLLTVLLLKQVLSLCAALSGGLSLEAMGQVVPLAARAWQASGMSYVSTRAATLTRSVADKRILKKPSH